MAIEEKLMYMLRCNFGEMVKYPLSCSLSCRSVKPIKYLSADMDSISQGSTMNRFPLLHRFLLENMSGNILTANQHKSVSTFSYS